MNSIYITNLPVWMDEMEITKEFSEIGAIKRIHITPNKILLKSVALVQFGQSNLAHNAAYKKNGIVIGGCAIRVYVVWTPKENLTTVRVTNIPEEIDDEELVALFSPFGDVIDTCINDDQNDAMVSFTRIDYALQAVQEMDDAIIGNYDNIKVELVNPDARNLKWKRVRFEYIKYELPLESLVPSQGLSRSPLNRQSYNAQPCERGSNCLLMPPMVGSVKTPSPSLSAISTTTAASSQHSIAPSTQSTHPIQSDLEMKNSSISSNLYNLPFSTCYAQGQESTPAIYLAQPNYITIPLSTGYCYETVADKNSLSSQPLPHKIGFNTSKTSYSAVGMSMNDFSNVNLNNRITGINNGTWNFNDLSISGMSQNIANNNFVENVNRQNRQNRQNHDDSFNMRSNINVPSIAGVATTKTNTSNQGFVNCNYEQIASNSIPLPANASSQEVELENKNLSTIWTSEQQELGDQIYHKLQKNFPERVAKITGVILKHNSSRIKTLLTNNDLLLQEAGQINKVLEAVVPVKNL